MDAGVIRIVDLYGGEQRGSGKGPLIPLAKLYLAIRLTPKVFVGIEGALIQKKELLNTIKRY